MVNSQISRTNIRLANIVNWSKLITLTGSAQMLVQGVGLVGGIMIIRLLSTEEYALYTLANTMLGTMTVLADGGIGAGVMSQGGKVWQDKAALGSVVVTGLYLRKRFAIGSLMVALPILFYLLIKNGASMWMAVLIVLTLVPAFIAALSDSLLEITLKVKQEIKPLQKNQVWVAIVRLFCILPLYFSPFAALAIIAGGVPRILGNIKLKRLISKSVDLDQDVNVTVRENILKSVKNILPGAIYYCISAQITIWLISIFGNSKAIAQVGALSRLTMVLALVTTIFNTLAIPRFSRLPTSRTVLLRNFVKVVLALTIFSFLTIGVVYFFPNIFLAVLGSGYTGISSELVLTVIGSCLSLSAGILYSLSTCRAWLISPLIYIPINVLCIILTVIMFDVSTLRGALMITIVASGIQVIMNIVYCSLRIIRTQTN